MVAGTNQSQAGRSASAEARLLAAGANVSDSQFSDRLLTGTYQPRRGDVSAISWAPASFSSRPGELFFGVYQRIHRENNPSWQASQDFHSIRLIRINWNTDFGEPDAFKHRQLLNPIRSVITGWPERFTLDELAQHGFRLINTETRVAERGSCRMNAFSTSNHVCFSWAGP